MNSSSPSIITHRPDEGGDVRPLPVDVAALRQRLEAVRRRYGSLRFMRAGFRVPWPLTERQFEQALNQALDKWVRVQESRGWTLRSKPRVIGMALAYSTSGDWYHLPLLDQREVQVVAAFSTDAKPMRLELEVAG